MNQDFQIGFFRWVIVIFAFWVQTACHSGKGNQAKSIEKLMNTSQSELTEAYLNYLQRKNLAAFISVEPSTDLMFSMKSDFKQDVDNTPDLLYFPSTLWQMFAISREQKWKQSAKNFSKIIIEANVKDFSKEPDAYWTLLYSSYLNARNQGSLIRLLESLSGMNTQQEEVFSLDSLSKLSKILPVNKLLANEVLFFASKETGDPVYRNLAIQISEQISNGFSGSNSFDTSENSKNQVLENRRMAIGLYGFSYLFKETGMEKYNRLSNLLGNNFARVYLLAERDKTNESSGCINREMDLETQALVAIALFDHPGMNFRETSVHFFQHILTTLSKTDNCDETKVSFQLFYYLFEYEKRLKNAGNGTD